MNDQSSVAEMTPAPQLSHGDPPPFELDESQLEGAAAMMPRAGYRFSRKIVMLSEPSSDQAECIGSMRAQLLAQHVRNGRRSLAFCAPEPAVGSTYLAVNLAVAFAQAGLNTLLIDANMRDPGVQNFIQPEAEPSGLQQCLLGTDVAHTSAIHEDVLQNLSILYSGGAADNSQELLATRQFKSMIDNCMRDYEMTIVDTPPGISAADGIRIATVVGYAVVVARRDHTRVGQIRDLMEELTADRARIVGSFLNDF